MGKLFDELKRRKVFRIAGVYAVVGWVLAQVAAFAVETFAAPQWVQQIFVVFLILGFPLAILLAWAYEVTPDGVRADSGSQVQVQIPTPQSQILIYAIFLLVLLAVGFQISDRFLTRDSQPNRSDSNTTSGSASSVMRTSLIIDQSLTSSAERFRTALALTADGSRLFYTQPGVSSQVWERNLITQQTRVLIEDADPAWLNISPDGERLLISSRNNTLIIVSLRGDSSQVIPVSDLRFAGEWLTDGEILYTAQDRSIHRISLSGDLDESLTQSIVGTQMFPDTLPEGTAFLYANFPIGPGSASLNQGTINLYDFGDTSNKILITDAYLPQYAPSGHIIFIRSGDLWAVPFDLDSLEITGVAARVVEGISSQSANGTASYVFSESGRLIYLAGREFVQESGGFNWIDRTGSTQNIPLPEGNYLQPELSPDGQSLAVVSIQGDGSRDIWVWDLARETFGKKTFTGNALRPKWTPDGTQIAYQLPNQGIWIVNADGTGQAEQIISSTIARPESFSAIDGKFHFLDRPVGFASINTASYRDDVWSSTPFIETEFDTWGAMVSPDGRWIAFSSNESGRGEVYVHTYPDITQGKWQISSDGGREPRWNPNGDELFYFQQNINRLEGILMSVSINGDNEDSPEPGTPLPILEGLPSGAGFPPSYVVANDGESFIVLSGLTELLVNDTNTENTILNVVENWFEELKRLAPSDQN